MHRKQRDGCWTPLPKSRDFDFDGFSEAVPQRSPDEDHPAIKIEVKTTSSMVEVVPVLSFPLVPVLSAEFHSSQPAVDLGVFPDFLNHFCH